MPEKPFNITHPSSEQLWACLQRCVTFEDPAARWERLQGLVRKQVGDHVLKARDVPSLPLEYQDHLFAQIYGGDAQNGDQPEPDKASILLNVILALQDIDRFTEIAFDSWRVSVPDNKNVKEMVRLFPKFDDDAEITALCEALDFSPAQKVWLQHSRRAVPKWTTLNTSGPWSSDARGLFLIAQLKQLSNLECNVEGFLQGKKLFDAALEKQRSKLPGSFLPRLLLLVEGETETILVPHFARLVGYDFSEMGVMLVSAGGGKQVARRYFELRDVVTLPMVLLTDADAGEEVEVAAESLRENDRLHVWKDGEIEDTLDTDTLVQQLNTFLQTSGAPGYVSSNDFPAGHRRTVILNRLWRARGLGNFDKIGFAEVVATNLREKGQVPKDVIRAIELVQKLLQFERQKAALGNDIQSGT